MKTSNTPVKCKAVEIQHFLPHQWDLMSIPPSRSSLGLRRSGVVEVRCITQCLLRYHKYQNDSAHLIAIFLNHHDYISICNFQSYCQIIPRSKQYKPILYKFFYAYKYWSLKTLLMAFFHFKEKRSWPADHMGWLHDLVQAAMQAFFALIILGSSSSINLYLQFLTN